MAASTLQASRRETHIAGSARTNYPPQYSATQVRPVVRYMVGIGCPFHVLTRKANLLDWELADWAIAPVIACLYECYIGNVFLTKGEACSHIRARHPQTCDRYLLAAEKEGLISLDRDPGDRRKVLVRAKQRLCRRVEKRAADVTDGFRRTLGEMIKQGPLPDDGLPFAGVRNPISENPKGSANGTKQF